MTDMEPHVARLESDVHDIKATLGRLEPMIIRIDATMPFLATKAELADKPGKVFLMGSMTLLIAVYALGLAGLAALPTLRALGG